MKAFQQATGNFMGQMPVYKANAGNTAFLTVSWQRAVGSASNPVARMRGKFADRDYLQKGWPGYPHYPLLQTRPLPGSG